LVLLDPLAPLVQPVLLDLRAPKAVLDQQVLKGLKVLKVQLVRQARPVQLAPKEQLDLLAHKDL
jgi:hypothetical protein